MNSFTLVGPASINDGLVCLANLRSLKLGYLWTLGPHFDFIVFSVIFYQANRLI